MKDQSEEKNIRSAVHGFFRGSGFAAISLTLAELIEHAEYPSGGTYIQKLTAACFRPFYWTITLGIGAMTSLTEYRHSRGTRLFQNIEHLRPVESSEIIAVHSPFGSSSRIEASKNANRLNDAPTSTVTLAAAEDRRNLIVSNLRRQIT